MVPSPALPIPPSDTAGVSDWARYTADVSVFCSRLNADTFTVSADELDGIHKLLLRAPGAVDLGQRSSSLSAIAQYHYVAGNALIGIEPGIDALILARQLGEPVTVMRALNTLAYCLTDTVDIAGATECFVEALELAVSTKNQLAECSLWNGLGGALTYNGQREESRLCFERAIATAGSHRFVRAAAHTNLALGYLNDGDAKNGIDHARAALELMPNPVDSSELLTRVLTETYYARLLIETNNHVEAAERIAVAKALAERSNSERARHAAAVAEGVCEVARGQADIGLSRLNRLLEHARAMRTALRDTLLALVSAYRYLGELEKAEVHLRELSLIARNNHRDYLRKRLPALWNTSVQGPAKNASVDFCLNDPVQRAQVQVLERLALQADLVDDPSGLHPFRVGKLSALMAADFGSDKEVCAAITTAGRLHDIGKYGLRLSPRAVSAAASGADQQRDRMHAEVGSNMLNDAAMPLLVLAEDVARHHHENFDGSGYPDGLWGSAIPFAARVVALANAFDSLLWPRGSHGRMSVDQALDEIAAGRATRFDPQLTDLFIAMVLRLRNEDPQWLLALEVDAAQSPYFYARGRIATLLGRGSTAPFPSPLGNRP